MAPYESDDSARAAEADDRLAGRRKAARYVVPVAVVGVAAATIGLVPALADSGDPSLPKITAQQLIEKIAKSDVQQLSGTVKVSTDLGLPNLGGLESGLLSGAAKGHGGSSADPQSKLLELASGTHTLRVAADGPDRGKVSLLENAAEYSVIHNGKDVWGYDSKSNEVFHSASAESGHAGEGAEGKAPRDVPATPKDFADEVLKSVDDTTSVTVDGTEHVAGRDAYKLLIKPRQSGSTVGAISIAVDSRTGLPLKSTLTPASGGAAVVDAGFTQVDFSRPAASTFAFTPPKGAKVTEGDTLKGAKDGESKGLKGDEPKNMKKAWPKGHEAKADGLGGPKTIGKGWNSIVVLDAGGKDGGKGLPSGASGSTGNSGVDGFLNSLGDHVTGKFGSGTVYSTRLVNALITDDGKVYAGAVTKAALVKAANAAQ
ncbi:DUF2092 domain-containing protein [Streptomyces sp. NPDC005281]|uniref:LolA family protein n=1 Tax=Streptomyces sp. NPDC005281 TaxID=3155712 RepID=UPI0033B3E556